MITKMILVTILFVPLSNCHQTFDNKASDTFTGDEYKKAAPASKDSVFTRQALYRSLDYGQTWTAVNTGLPREAQVAFMEKSGERIVMATDNYGIFISDPDRQTWRNISAALPDVKISALYLSGNEIYAGVYRKGIYVSNDAGQTWLSLNRDLKDLNVRAILKVNGELLLGTDSGIFKSGNGQKTWKQKFSECQIVSLNEEKGKIVAGGVFGVLLSLDAGERWDWIHKEGAAHNTAIVGGNIVVMNISEGGLFISEDWGKSWKMPEYGPRERSYIYETARAGDHWIFSNNYGIHRSGDEGTTWENIFKTEDLVFIDFVVFDEVIYGGTRRWDEYRKKSML